VVSFYILQNEHGKKFVKVCRKLEKEKGIQNCKMLTEKIDNKIKYTYKLEPGISEVKGGINVLSDMNYPKEIIDNTIKENNQ
jgi:DNA mismatch repair ATPase MutS